MLTMHQVIVLVQKTFFFTPSPPSPPLSLPAVYEIADNLIPQFIPDSPAKRQRLGLPEEMYVILLNPQFIPF